MTDEDGVVRMGSKSVFLKRRTEGTERADKAGPGAGRPEVLRRHAGLGAVRDPAPVDVVIVPAIDGNFDPSSKEMIPFERQFQTLHSLQNYFLLNELLAPGIPMPIVDTEALRTSAGGVRGRFADRPYHFVRAATPQVLLDEVDRVL